MAELVKGGSPCSSLQVASGGLGFSLLFFCSVILSSLLAVLGFWRILLGLMRNSLKPGFPTFVVQTSLEEFTREVDGWLPLLPEVSLPRLSGEVVRRKDATAGSLDGSGWREFKALLVSWFDGLARIFSKVEDTGVWPEGLLDAYIALIPKTDGNAAPLGQRPLSVLPVVYRIWASARMGQLDGCSSLGFLVLSLVLGTHSGTRLGSAEVPQIQFIDFVVVGG